MTAPAGDRVVHVFRRRRGWTAIDLHELWAPANCQIAGHAEGYLFDEAALRAEYARAFFVAPRTFDPGQSDEAARRGIDGRTDPVDALLLLTMEAVRPRD